MRYNTTKNVAKQETKVTVGEVTFWGAFILQWLFLGSLAHVIPPPPAPPPSLCGPEAFVLFFLRYESAVER